MKHTDSIGVIISWLAFIISVIFTDNPFMAITLGALARVLP